MGHGMEAGMKNLIVHGKNKDPGEMLFHQRLEISATFTVYMPSLAGGRSVELGLQRGHAENEDPVLFKRGCGIPDERILLFPRNMFENIQRVNAIEGTRHRALEQVMHCQIHRPIRIHPRPRILNENLVEIHRTESAHFLLDQATAGSIATTDLKDAGKPAKHPGHKLVTRQNEKQLLGILRPNLRAP